MPHLITVIAAASGEDIPQDSLEALVQCCPQRGDAHHTQLIIRTARAGRRRSIELRGRIGGRLHTRLLLLLLLLHGMVLLLLLLLRRVVSGGRLRLVGAVALARLRIPGRRLSLLRIGSWRLRLHEAGSWALR